MLLWLLHVTMAAFLGVCGVGMDDAGEWLIIKDLYVSIQHFRMGIPGMLVQIIGGYAVLKAIAKR